MSERDNRNTVGVVERKLTFEWKIHDFWSQVNDWTFDEYLCSPVFTTCNANCMKWKLKLYPYGNEDKNSDYISLLISYLGEEEITTVAEISLLNSQNFVVRNTTKVFKFEYKHGVKSREYGHPRYMLRSYVTTNHNVLHNGILKILCQITVVSSLAKLTSFNHECFENNIVPQYRLKGLNDLENLWETGDHSDINFKIDKTTFKAHKAIVTSRSPVFKAMFDHDMVEKKNNEIEVVDIKPEVMKELLRFLYTSKVKNIEKIALDLLPAAEKYSIRELKLLCERTLYGDLTIQNSVEYLTIADMYNTIKLKSKVIEFIVKNQKNIGDNDKFKSLMASNPELFWEVFRAVTSK